ncbi:hypothetical protein [Runella sp.]|uniref:hypothetical protein n=1 Tax=Runella sp. TaxID=1960881 RepID=UPI003D13C33C
MKSGKVVETSLGMGKTTDGTQLINGKVQVVLDDGKKLLCSPEKVKIVGFWHKRFG